MLLSTPLVSARLFGDGGGDVDLDEDDDENGDENVIIMMMRGRMFSL
jgi:hypothetical protein